MGITRAAFLVLLVFVINLVYSYQSLAMSVEEKLDLAKQRCAPFQESDPLLYMDNFKWGLSVADMDRIYEETYQDDGRLPERVGYFEESDSFLYKAGDKNESDFPQDYLKSLITQVEKLLKLNYVKYVFYSDMGHSHLFIPMDYYESFMKGEKYGPYKAISVALSSKGLKTLYHTAEQLYVRDDETKKLFEDTYLQWRFYTRNPVVGLNADVELLTDFSGPANTVRDYWPKPEGYKYYAGFYISANKNGCFPFENKEGELNYFDLSFDSPVYRSTGGQAIGFNSHHPHRPGPLEAFGWKPVDEGIETHPSYDLINH